ncbi:MAG: phospho-N-acetylmuramoyl-pentapeptide-transferase [Elusimicrobia bacterium]|nr:phospho-N-acetylmuramoyl-pentapeptide-transferase [Elusimicrobiota bacterium]
MLYYLSFLKFHFSPFNVLSYITFRSGAAILTSLVLTWLFAPRFIAAIKNSRVSQPIREEGPPTHLRKAGTPTMGGLLILMTTLLSTFLWARLDNRFIWITILTSTFLGGLGFLDDFLKWKNRDRQPRGLSPALKILAQMSLAIGVVSYLFFYPPNAEFRTQLNIPYMKNLFVDLGAGYILFALITIVGSSNAVNLTDGLDGLAIGSLAISALTYALFSYLSGHAKFSQYLGIVPVAGAGELAVFLSAVVGASLGFLWYNCYPAEIFMGDTGSLFLGGSLGVIAVIIRQELILVIVGGLFVIEALSVLIQVASYRYRGQRIFKMAPLHHHFELCGWQEPKVTARFWILSIVLSLIALTSLKLR